MLGPSGAGKTTLIKILTGQIRYDGGRVRVFEKKPEELTREDKKKFGIMMDNFGVYERFSCGNSLSVFADIYGVSHGRIPEVLKEVGLEIAYKKSASDLSKGMRARLQLARAFLHTPEILFLDEPTSGLDPQTMRGIHGIILEKKKAGCTIFLTTHNMEEATKLCDKVALLNEGRIIEEGKPEEICRRYDHHKKIKIHLSNGQDVEFDRSQQDAEKISELLKTGMLETIHSTEPTLESVFLELTGRKLEEDETILLDAGKILYIEAVERTTFVYTIEETYESALKLYEFEQQLSEKDFIRISKQGILNLRKVKSLKTDINRKIRVTLINGEQIIVSRMYADELRKRLGIK